LLYHFEDLFSEPSFELSLEEFLEAVKKFGFTIKVIYIYKMQSYFFIWNYIYIYIYLFIKKKTIKTTKYQIINHIFIII